MKYYPVNLDVRNRECLVVGGGGIGTRKVETLLKCGAKVTVISLAASPKLAELAEKREISLLKRPYESEDQDGKFLIIAATDDESLNRRIYEDAEKSQKPCNIVDRPEICSFIVPSIISRGDLTIAISTSGTSPAFAKRLRKDLETMFGKEYETFLELMGAVREKVLKENRDPDARKVVFEQLAGSGIPEMIRDGDTAGIDRILRDVLGKGYGYEDLMGG